MTLIKKAICFAAEKHDGQYRKGNVPFIAHPFSVAMSVSDYTKDENTIAAAVLHDVMEDCDVKTHELKKEFGLQVSDLVDQVSIFTVEKKWINRKKKYLKKISKASKEALIIVGADKIYNMEGYFSYIFDNEKKEKNLFNGDIDGYFWYYGEILEALKKNEADKILIKDYEKVFNFFSDKYKLFQNRK